MNFSTPPAPANFLNGFLSDTTDPSLRIKHYMALINSKLLKFKIVDLKTVVKWFNKWSAVFSAFFADVRTFKFFTDQNSVLSE